MIVLALFLCALAGSPQREPAVLVHGGRILVGDAGHSSAGALLAEGGVIVALGSLPEVSRHPAAARARRLDLKGSVAVPGLQDAHVNLQAMVENRTSEDFSDVSSAADLLQRVAASAARLPEGTWILGRGLNPSHWSEGHIPSAKELAQHSAFHPVYIEFHSGHEALANTAALKFAGLEGRLNTPPRIVGGRVVPGEDSDASGVLIGAARELVRRHIQPELDGQWETQFPKVEQQLIEQGLTCVHDLGTQPEFVRFLERRRAQKLLRLRVVCYPTLGTEPMSLDVGPRREDLPSDTLSVPGIHLVLDASLDLRQAALLDAYEGWGNERGGLLTDEDRLANRLLEAARKGLSPCIEAHGDRAVRAAIDGWERLCGSVPDARQLLWRIQGLELVAPRDWPRLAQLKVASGLEPLVSWREPAPVAKWIGPHRLEERSGWRSLAVQQQFLSLSSGATDPLWADPRRTLFGARSPAPRGLGLPGSLALAAMTSTPSQICGQGARRGSLEMGRRLDLSALSEDPTRIEPNRLGSVAIRGTLIDGRVEFWP